MKSKILILAALLSFVFVANATETEEKSLNEIIELTTSEEIVDLNILDQSAQDVLIEELGSNTVQISFRQVRGDEIYALGIDLSGNYTGAVQLTNTRNVNSMEPGCGICGYGDNNYQRIREDWYLGSTVVYCAIVCSTDPPIGPGGKL